jgi:hypothetical protein
VSTARKASRVAMRKGNSMQGTGAVVRKGGGAHDWRRIRATARRADIATSCRGGCAVGQGR